MHVIPLLMQMGGGAGKIVTQTEFVTKYLLLTF